MSARLLRGAAVLALALGGVLAVAPAQAGAPRAVEEEPESTTTETEDTGDGADEETDAPPPGDGVLRIATLLPSQGEQAAQSLGQRAAAELAIRDVNDAGGVLGVPVELLHRDSVADPAAVVQGLVDRGVDAVIVADSAGLEPFGAALADAGILIIVTTGDELTAGPLQFALGVPRGGTDATLATLVRERGESVAVLSTGGVPGAQLLTALAVGGAPGLDAEGAPREAAPFSVTATSIPADPTLFADAAATALAAPADTLLLDADADTARALIPLLLEQGLEPGSLVLSARATADLQDLLPAGALDGAAAVRAGVDPTAEFVTRLRQADPWLSSAVRTVDVYDAVAVLALAAQAAGNDHPQALAASLPTVTSRDGVLCGSPGECLAALADGQAVDYRGPSGLVGLDSSGRLLGGAVTVLGYEGVPAPVAVELRTVGLGTATAQEASEPIG